MKTILAFTMALLAVGLFPLHAQQISSKHLTTQQRTAIAAGHIARGKDLRQRGQTGAAIHEFRKALHIDAENADAHQLLALSLFRSNKTPHSVMDEAIQHEQRAVALRPQKALYWYNLGAFLLMRKRYIESITANTAAIRLLPNIKPFLLYGSPSHDHDSTLSARAALLCHAHADLGVAYLKTRQYAKAVPEYQLALAFDPTAGDWLVGLGHAFDKLGQKSQARATWQKVISAPSSMAPYVRQAQQRLARG